MQSGFDGRDTLKPLALWRDVSLLMVRGALPDLTARQLAVLLTIYVTDPPHTVRGLSRELGVAKPAITRALDALGRAGLVKRRRDPEDRRNVLVQRTVKGAVYLREFADYFAKQTVGPQLAESAELRAHAG